MSQILKLTHENQKLKRQINQYQQVLGVSPYVDDSLFKGGYRVVKTINDRNNIDCCHSKQGMIVCVIGEDLSFKEYRLISDCKNKQWEEIQTQVTENDVILVEDYSELSENLTTQKELNLVLKQLILNLQTALDGKQDKLSSYDESILIENDGNIEGNVSLFQEYFEQQECELNFTPIQIIGVYLNGIKQKPSLYTIIPPKTISVTNFVTNDYIEIQYTKLKI